MKIDRIIPPGTAALRAFFRKPLGKALSSVSSLLDDIHRFAQDRESSAKMSREIFMILGAVLRAGGDLSSRRISELHQFLLDKYSEKDISQILSFMQDDYEFNPAKSAEKLSSLDEEEKSAVITALFEAASSCGDISAEQSSMIVAVAKGLGINDKKAAEIKTQVLVIKSRHERILKSGTGIIMAVVVIAIFVLTATFLKSVLFGLVLAYFLAPLEQWFEKKFFSNPMVKVIENFFMHIFKPFKNMLSSARSKLHMMNTEEKLSVRELEKRSKERLTAKACMATVISFLIFAGLLLTLILSFSASYFAGLGSSVKNWADKNVSEEKNISESQREKSKIIVQQLPLQSDNPNESPKKSTIILIPKSELNNVSDDEKDYFRSLLSAGIREIESMKPKLEGISWFKWGVDYVADYLKNKENREKILSLALSKTSGVFSYTASFFGGVFYTLLHLMLTVFFFVLFLQKIAAFNAARKRTLEPGDYLVRSIFGTSWMPQTSSDTKEEARQILNDIFGKLKAWVKGYISIILIEVTLYITCFLLLKVPYAPILGLIAGCTILLPFIGPIASGALTIIVCFAIGNVSMINILGVVMSYVIITGMLDQLFTYPKFVGSALGLSTIETIIVVLLGGLFCGLPGMIFAVPTASVLKYLIPKIYECWQR